MNLKFKFAFPGWREALLWNTGVPGKLQGQLLQHPPESVVRLGKGKQSSHSYLINVVCNFYQPLLNFVHIFALSLKLGM